MMLVLNFLIIFFMYFYDNVAVGNIKLGKLTNRTRIVIGVAAVAIFIVLISIIVAGYVFRMKKLRK